MASPHWPIYIFLDRTSGKGVTMSRRLVQVLVSVLACLLPACSAQSKKDLSVAVFAYTPEAAATAATLEAQFEQHNKDVDVDIEVIDPYSIGLGHGEVFDSAKVAAALSRFDVVEIDVCRLNDLRPHLDKLPRGSRNLGAPYITAVRDALAKAGTSEYVVPHWACGNLLVSWSPEGSKEVDTFAELCRAGTGTPGSAVLSDFYGGTGLGEYYADWLADHYGIEQARQRLKALGTKTPPKPTPEQEADEGWFANPAQREDLDPQAVKDFRAMVGELHPAFVKQIGRFHDVTDVYPRQFESRDERTSFLLGYSERLYYVGKARALDPKHDKDKVKIEVDEVDVRPLTFGDRPGSTPVWIDGFVIPMGKLDKNKSAIESFLKFASSPQAYAIFQEPIQYGPASYLLPASAAEYEGEAVKKSPALPKFRDALDAAFVLDDSDVWRGIKYAGELLKEEVKEAATTRPAN